MSNTTNISAILLGGIADQSFEGDYRFLVFKIFYFVKTKLLKILAIFGFFFFETLCIYIYIICMRVEYVDYFNYLLSINFRFLFTLTDKFCSA